MKDQTVAFIVHAVQAQDNSISEVSHSLALKPHRSPEHALLTSEEAKHRRVDLGTHHQPLG